MKCSKCGRPLLSNENYCKYCNLSKNNYKEKKQREEEKNIMLLSEKYGKKVNITYREAKENKLLGAIIITIILLILIIITILVNVKAR